MQHSTPPPSFFYFDLGIVLVDFTIERMLRQIGEVSGVDPARVEEVLFGGGLQQQCELGRISDRRLYDAFCRQTGTRPDFDALKQAGSDIFELNLSMLPVVTQLGEAGCRMGILSNTCESHWLHCRRRFRMIDEGFELYALSYQIGVAKPDAAIFRAAARLAGVEPHEVFFVDDIAGHVAGAKAVGFDAVQYTSTPELVAELRRRGVRFNY
ncbi:MAG: HAD family phosphatase [Pirellulales bacterium]|nr:HAD family phosphatase [Pirellulales bacterium]